MVFASHHIFGICVIYWWFENNKLGWIQPKSFESWNSQEGKRKSVWLYFCLICTALPLSSHSGSHNPPSPTNLLPDLPIKSLMPHFMPPRVRTYLVLQHTCTCRLQWKPFSKKKWCRARIYFSFSGFIHVVSAFASKNIEVKFEFWVNFWYFQVRCTGLSSACSSN